MAITFAVSVQYEPLYVMSVVLRVMVLIVEGRITGRPVHHAGRLSVHHVAHRRVRTVCPARSCRQWWKHYTLLRLDLCSVIGRRVLDKARRDPFQSSRGTRELDDHSILGIPLIAKRWDEGDREERTSRDAAEPCDAIRQSHDHVSDNSEDLCVS